jgi:putative transposase
VVVTAASSSYKGHRYPPEIIAHCVWLYHRFPLSFREVEELMLARGVAVSYETIRQWCAKFGQSYANRLRRRQAQPGDKWHLDEVFIRINGTIHYLWRAVDQHGNVLDILVQPRRNAVAAKKFFRKLLKGLQYVPRVIVTDGLSSYQVAHRELIASVQHRRSKYLNNRAENSHQPTRQRERAMKRFTSPRACTTVPVRVQPHLAAFPSASASAVGDRMAPRDGRPLHRVEPDHRGDHGLRLNVSSDRASTRTYAQHANDRPESPSPPIKLTVPRKHRPAQRIPRR